MKKVNIYDNFKLANGTTKTYAKFDVGALGMRFGYFLLLTFEPKVNTLTWTLDYRYNSDFGARSLFYSSSLELKRSDCLCVRQTTTWATGKCYPTPPRRAGPDSSTQPKVRTAPLDTLHSSHCLHSEALPLDS